MANTTKKYVSLDKLGLYDKKIKAKIKADDEAAAASAVATANAYADSLASNYDAAGAAATAETNAKTYTDGQIAAINGTIAGVKTTAEKGVTDAATAQAAAEAAQGEVDALETYVGTFEASEGVDTVVKYIDAKTANIASDETVGAIADRITQAEKDIDNIEKDYLKAADKTTLEGKIDAKADQTALDEVSTVANAAVAKADYNTKVAALEAEDTRIAGLVSAEAERAAGVESGLEERLEGVEAFFKLAEGESLDTALDTLKEIQTYITTEGSEADQMVKDIAANTKAIEDMDAAYKAADETLQSNIDTLADVVDGKVAQGDFDTLSSKVTTAEGKISANETAITTLQDEDTAIKGRLDTLEVAIGESGSVADDIATAKQEAIDAAAGDATTKANTAETNAKAHANSLNTAMNTRVEALEAIDHDHTNKTVLDGITAEKVTGWDSASAKVHEHSNLSVLEGITAEKVTAWDKVTAKADQTALQAEIDRATAAEKANADAIAAFVEVSEEEINQLFQ